MERGPKKRFPLEEMFLDTSKQPLVIKQGLREQGSLPHCRAWAKTGIVRGHPSHNGDSAGMHLSIYLSIYLSIHKYIYIYEFTYTCVMSI